MTTEISIALGAGCRKLTAPNRGEEGVNRWTSGF
jgi:hypothetical protein